MIIEDQEDAQQTTKKKTESAKETENIYKVQCFPLYSMLVTLWAELELTISVWTSKVPSTKYWQPFLGTESTSRYV